jgi:hypothetical protein
VDRTASSLSQEQNSLDGLLLGQRGAGAAVIAPTGLSSGDQRLSPGGD